MNSSSIKHIRYFVLQRQRLTKTIRTTAHESELSWPTSGGGGLQRTGKPLAKWYIFSPLWLVLPFFLLFQGCLGVDSGVLADTKKIESMKSSSPIKLSMEYKKLKAEDPQITLLSTKEFSDLPDLIKIPRFLAIADKEIPKKGFELDKKLGNKFTQITVSEDAELKERLFFDHGLPKSEYNLILVDDFSGISAEMIPWFLPDLHKLVFLTEEESFLSISEKSQISTLSKTSEAFFPEKGPFVSPLGISKNTSFLPFAMDLYTISYNLVAFSAFQQTKILDAKKKSTVYEEKLISEMSPRDFFSWMAENRLEFFYPDAQSTTPEVSKAGQAFLCQLLLWLEPATYEKFLSHSFHPSALEALDKIESFLKKNQNVFKKQSSLETILEAVVSQNLIRNLPPKMDLSRIYDYEELPSDWNLEDQEFRLTFGYIPESVKIRAFSKEKYNELNADYLQKKRQERLEKLKKEKEIKERKRQLQLERAGKGKKKTAKSAKQKSAPQTETATSAEEPQDGEKEDSPKEEGGEEEEEKAKEAHNISQVGSTVISHLLGRRIYFATPLNSGKKQGALMSIHAFLQPDFQMAFLEPGRLSPSFRSIRPSIPAVFYVPKKVEDKTMQKKNPWFPVQEGWLSPSDIENRFYPILNARYLSFFSKKR